MDLMNSCNLTKFIYVFLIVIGVAVLAQSCIPHQGVGKQSFVGIFLDHRIHLPAMTICAVDR
jgi:hypothetical protein